MVECARLVKEPFKNKVGAALVVQVARKIVKLKR